MATKLATKIVQHLVDFSLKFSRDCGYYATDAEMSEELTKFLADRTISKKYVERLRADLIREKLVSHRHYNRAQALKDRLWDTEKELAEVKKALAAANEIAWRPASPYVAGTFVHVQEADMPAPVSLWQRVTNWSR